MVVLERAPTIGGLAASFEVGGMRVDHGSHRLHPAASSEVRAELEAILGDDLQVRPRNGRLRLADRWVAFPPRPFDLARRLPARIAGGLVRDALLAPLRRPRADTFAEVVRAGLGPTMLHEFYGPYVRKIWATEPDELSGELARRRVGARSPSALLRKVVAPRRAGRGGDGKGTFLYPRRGFGQIIEGLADAAATAGAEIRTSAEVTALDLRDDGATATLADGSTVTSRVILSTVPVPALAGLAGAPPPVRAAAGALTFRSLALVYLVLERPYWTSYDAHYLPGPDIACSRISEPKRYRDAPSDPPSDQEGRTVLCAEVPCSTADEIWNGDDRALGELVAAGVSRLGLPDATPTEVVVRRVPNAYPVYRCGFEAHLTVLDRWVGEQPSLLTFGRQGLFAHDNTHHALAMGFAAADALADGVLDAPRWARARAEFAAHVVED